MVFRAFRYLLLAAAAMPLCAAPKGAARIPLPADLSGTLNGTEYKIRVPANWNGTLLVWAHGALTVAVQVAPQPFPSIAPSVEDQLLSRGYALAGARYVDSEKEGAQRTLELTHFFKGAVANPQRTIVWGLSLGGMVAGELIETHPGVYDGGIAVSFMGAGEPKNADFLLRYDLAYAAAFGWPSALWGPIEDLRDDLYLKYGTVVAPAFQWASDANYGQWEFIRLVMKEQPTAWWGTDRSVGFVGYSLAGWAATAYRSHWEQLCGGPIAQNIDDVYELTPEEKAYLGSLGVDADQLLRWMNDHANIAARHSARNRLEHFGGFTGDLRRPLLTVHGILDPFAPVSGESEYRSAVDARGQGDKLVQAYANTWHATFSASQYLSALAAMDHWLDTGVRPDASFFPEAQGFDTAFVPPPWPY